MPLKTRTPGLGLMKGLGITLKTMMSPASTQQYPHVRPDLPPRTRGVIALMDENCTVCMLCSRECPDWCIYIDSHKETVPPAKEGGRARTRNMLDRFAIDFALCMYCGICIEVCPFDALFWSPEFEYSEYSITGLLHEKERLREWMDTVPAPPRLDEGADQPTEVVGALDKAASAQATAIEAEQAKSVEAAEAKEAAAAPAEEKKPDVHVDDAGEIDQETYDQLIAEGKSERIARSKAKAAYVRRRKKELAAEQEASAPDAAAETPEAPPTDQEAPEAPAEVPAADADAAPAAEGKPRAADIHVEGGEIDQETYDQLIAEGKSERIARAKAKAAWVRKRKQEIIDSGADSGGAEGGSATADDGAGAADDDSGEGGEA